jgi:hypothetical protein
MNKSLKYTIIGASVLAGGYVAYLIYSKLHEAIVDSRVVTPEQAMDEVNNI